MVFFLTSDPPFLSESADQQDLGERRQLYFSLIHKPEREMKNIRRNLYILFITELKCLANVGIQQIFVKLMNKCLAWNQRERMS